MPHVIISGMPGIGKTTSVLCLARQLLGESYKEAVLELNASDERGIQNFSFCSESFNTDIALCRYRCCPQSHKRLCAEESYPSRRSTQACYPR
jgi:DNA polymerase III delta prime subunit